MTKDQTDQGTGTGAADICDPIPKSVFDVTRMPLKQGISAWKEAMGTLSDTRFLDTPERQLPSRMKVWHIGEALLGTLETVSQEFKRSRYHIGLGGGDCYVVHFIEKGTVYFPAQDRKALPGDIVVLDRGEPLTHYAISSAPDTICTVHGLIIPQRLLDPFLALSDRTNPMIYDGALPLVALLRQHLQAFGGQLPDMAFSEAQAVIQPTVELLAAAMNGAATEANANAVNNAVVSEIQRHIAAHIKDPALSAATIAAAFSISTRKLYQLFEPFGGVVAYIQKKRLALVHAAIVDPGEQHWRIQDIAESYGFMQRKNFNAAFRRLYGFTPREARAYAAEGRSRNMYQAFADQNLWNWLLELR